MNYAKLHIKHDYEILSMYIFQVHDAIYTVLDGAYKIDNIRASSYTCITNIPARCALRGYGKKQGYWITEICMQHVAEALKISPEKVG